MADNPYEQAYAELQKRWPWCSEHKGHCYITKGGSFDGTHYDLDPREWGIWATALSNTKGVVDYPPRTEEFDQILDAILIKRNKKRRGIKGVNDTNVVRLLKDIDLFHHTTTPSIVYNMAPAASSVTPTRCLSDPGSPQKSRRQSSTLSLVDLLIKVGYKNVDFCDKALKDYLIWCDARYSGDYNTALRPMQKHNIGVDMVEDIGNPNEISNLCDIPYGTMLRILKNVRVWLTTLSSTSA
jgi:hypothetical protein